MPQTRSQSSEMAESDKRKSFSALPPEIRLNIFRQVFQSEVATSSDGVPLVGYFNRSESDHGEFSAIEDSIRHFTVSNLFCQGSENEIRDVVASTRFHASSVAQLETLQRMEKDYDVQFRKLNVLWRFTDPLYQLEWLNNFYVDAINDEMYEMIDKLFAFPHLRSLTLLLTECIDDRRFNKRHSFCYGSIRRIAYKVRELRDQVDKRSAIQSAGFESRRPHSQSCRILFCGLNYIDQEYEWVLLRTFDYTHLWDEPTQVDLDMLQKFRVRKAILREMKMNHSVPQDIPEDLERKEQELNGEVDWLYDGSDSHLQGISRTLLSMWSKEDLISSDAPTPE